MKKIIALILVICLSAALCGCSLFSTTSAEPATTAAGENTDIKMSDSYTFHDPEGLTYAARYAYTSGDNNPELNSVYQSNYGISIIAEYFILYADENDKALAEYDYYVFNNEEDAQTFFDALKDFGYNTKLDGSVVYIENDEEMVKLVIEMQMTYSGLASDKASDYAAFTKESYEYINLQ